MGARKQTLELAGKPMVQHVLDAFLGSGLGEVVLVLNPAISWRPRKRKGLRVVVNPRPDEGISSSLRTGLDAIDKRSKAVLIGLADKPLLKKSTIASLLHAYDQAPAEIIVPTIRGKRGNPVLFRRTLFGRLKGLKGDVGAKVLIEGGDYSVAEVPVDDVGILLDVDTPDDLQRARKVMSERSALSERKPRK